MRKIKKIKTLLPVLAIILLTLSACTKDQSHTRVELIFSEPQGPPLLGSKIGTHLYVSVYADAPGVIHYTLRYRSGIINPGGPQTIDTHILRNTKRVYRGYNHLDELFAYGGEVEVLELTFEHY